MIEFHAVSKRYPGASGLVPALHPIDLAIGAGEVFGVIGHSGAGKSTLIRLINRLETPSGGEVWVDGQDIARLDGAGLRALRRRIGMIFQHFNLLSSQTVADNVAFPLRLAGASPAAVAERVHALLARVGLSEQARKYPAQLSGGQKQRVGIARALATGPGILLCDEATSALDPQTTASVLDLLSRINRELGLTIVLITHEMDVVRRVCDRVAVLDGGHLVETGPVADVFLHPRHPATRHLVAEAGQVDEEAQAREWAMLPGRLLRLTLLGEGVHAPLLGQVARDTGVDYRWLSGRVDRIRDQPYAQFVLALQGGDVDRAQALLIDAGARVEVLRHG